MQISLSSCVVTSLKLIQACIRFLFNSVLFYHFFLNLLINLGFIFGATASVYRPVYGSTNFTSAVIVWKAQNVSSKYDIEVRQLVPPAFVQV